MAPRAKPRNEICRRADVGIGRVQTTRGLRFVGLFGRRVLRLLARQLLGLVTTHRPRLLLNVKPDFRLLPLQTNDSVHLSALMCIQKGSFGRFVL